MYIYLAWAYPYYIFHLLFVKANLRVLDRPAAVGHVFAHRHHDLLALSHGHGISTPWKLEPQEFVEKNGWKKYEKVWGDQISSIKQD